MIITMHALSCAEQFDDLMESRSDFIVFKHSGRCNISGGACREVYQAIDTLGLQHVYLVDVWTTGDLKYHIATQTKIRHESPQVIIFASGVVQAHASHSTISQGRLIHQLKGRHDTRKGIGSSSRQIQ